MKKSSLCVDGDGHELRFRIRRKSAVVKLLIKTDPRTPYEFTVTGPMLSLLHEGTAMSHKAYGTSVR